MTYYSNDDHPEEMKVLVLEDDPQDAFLINNEIKKALPEAKIEITTNREEFILSMVSFFPNLVISDYSLPDFSGLEALQIVMGSNEYMPFIFVTGTIENEELAAQTILKGASGYVLKGNLGSLPKVIKRCINDYTIKYKRNIKVTRLKKELDALSTELKGLFEELAQKKKDLNTNIYSEVQAYNELVISLNKKVTELQALIEHKIRSIGY